MVSALQQVEGVDIAIAPTFLALPSVIQTIQGSNIFASAQNCHQEVSGAYTGEISTGMLRNTGCTYVIIGHSERRQYFKESNQLIGSKIRAAFAAGLLPIFCIGETLTEREAGQAFDVVKTQITEALEGIELDKLASITIAYEPVWAIGTGVTATPEQAQEVHAFIRATVADHYDQSVADETSILYGGSCNPKNAGELFAQPDIDGGLIGGASLKSRDFLDIFKVFNK